MIKSKIVRNKVIRRSMNIVKSISDEIEKRELLFFAHTKRLFLENHSHDRHEHLEKDEIKEAYNKNYEIKPVYIRMKMNWWEQGSREKYKSTGDGAGT